MLRMNLIFEGYVINRGTPLIFIGEIMGGSIMFKQRVKIIYIFYP